MIVGIKLDFLNQAGSALPCELLLQGQHGRISSLKMPFTHPCAFSLDPWILWQNFCIVNVRFQEQWPSSGYKGETPAVPVHPSTCVPLAPL